MDTITRADAILYGGDHSPEQWLEYPNILERDIELMKKAGCNAVTMGMFAWAALEPEEGRYEFGWLSERLDKLHENGIHVILATPSGARPRWLAERYPEVLRVNADRRRDLFGKRHNHCYTSPVYREKLKAINVKLAEHFANHPAVILWHLSNEYGGECHCELCQKAFRRWLENRYGNIKGLNRAWNTAFWSHTYNSFEQVESPSPRGEDQDHGLRLDWKRFVTHQTIDFMKTEIAAVRPFNAELPITTNLMYSFDGLDYFKLGRELDLISWDTYPTWHKKPEHITALDNGFQHDLMRSIKKKPFLLMESTPSMTNWQGVSKLKKPGMNRLSSLQATAHGSDSVLYFQWRQSRNSVEKFHGAVVDHYGGEDTRVFQEAAALGGDLSRLGEILGSAPKSRVAVLYDWENDWAIQIAHGPRNKGMGYKEAIQKSYNALRKLGFNVDVADMESDLSGYRYLAAPMAYMLRKGFQERLRDFVEQGGTLLLSYWSGIVDESGLCFQGGTPHGLMDVVGLRMTEIDALYDHESNQLEPVAGNSLGLAKDYNCDKLCALVKTGTAEALMTYGQDFYAGTPAFTRNRFGKGTAYYLCADAEESFYDDACRLILADAGIKPDWEAEIPEGVEVTTREKDGVCYSFLQNFRNTPVQAEIPADAEFLLGDSGMLEAFGTVILRRKMDKGE